MAAPAQQADNPEVHFPPPILFVIAGLSGVGLETVVRMPLSSVLVVPAQMTIGGTAFIAGTGLLLWALTTFVRVKTAIYPNQPARLLVARGPYRLSRNPMYVALSAMTVGAGLLADNIWMLLLLPVVLVTLTIFVIRPEENYLADAFGKSYTDYQKRVRRWL